MFFILKSQVVHLKKQKLHPSLSIFEIHPGAGEYYSKTKFKTFEKYRFSQNSRPEVPPHWFDFQWHSVPKYKHHFD